ncbi:DUF4349 domain-containing protein [Dyadobacter sp. 676]|uniref:DUF4349 domain-containing protein n=1 Tax=Dyadobacter sp. 676 TaxID=3088362 RepID=A0AAU8FK48_9BACT
METRTAIEATEAQFRQLNGDIKYSTLHIVFFKPIDTSNPFLTEPADAFKGGVGNLRAFAVVLVAVWPFGLLVIGVAVALRRWKKKRKGGRNRKRLSYLKIEFLNATNWDVALSPDDRTQFLEL